MLGYDQWTASGMWKDFSAIIRDTAGSLLYVAESSEPVPEAWGKPMMEPKRDDCTPPEHEICCSGPDRFAGPSRGRETSLRREMSDEAPRGRACELKFPGIQRTVPLKSTIGTFLYRSSRKSSRRPYERGKTEAIHPVRDFPQFVEGIDAESNGVRDSLGSIYSASTRNGMARGAERDSESAPTP
jgi:hypothetical protein